MESDRASRQGVTLSKASPGRLVALNITRKIRERNAYAHELIEHELRGKAPHIELTTEERDFAILLIKGVVSTSGELDQLLDMALESGHIKPKIKDALRISTYEIIFLNKEPHAAVSQGVELVGSLSSYVTGFANKVLRNVVRLKESFPFGDPLKDLQALAHKQAFPLWLAQRLEQDLGCQAAALFMEASNTTAPLFLADINTGEIIKDHPSKLLDYIAKIKTGELIVADASAQQTAKLATPTQTPFLEVGSGRGTKTVLLSKNAQRETGKQPHIYALDLHPFKQNILKERIAEYSLENVHPITGDATKLDELVESNSLPSKFSGALIDAPCSGTGTMRRNPEIRWRLKHTEVSDMAAQGLSMLKSVSEHIAPKGFVVYSTCSALKEENEQVIEAFLSTDQGSAFVIEPATTNGDKYFRSALEPGSPDSHFAARLVRPG